MNKILKNTKNKFQKKSLENALKSIMTAEEYSHMKHSTPYIFELQTVDTLIFYFGTPHVFDPKNPIFEEIEAAFDEVNPDIIFVEGIRVSGGKSQLEESVKSSSRAEVIQEMGESGFVLKLGLKNGIEWHSPEPADEDLYKYLLSKGFSKEHIFTWYVFNLLPQYDRLMNRNGFKKYSEVFLNRFKQSTNWEDFNYSFEHAIKMGEQIIGRNIDVENEPNSIDLIDPIPWKEKIAKQTILNRICEQSSLLRDKAIVIDIATVLNTYKRLFIIYGSSHAVMQKPALRKLI